VSILIKDTDLPKRCFNCPFYDDEENFCKEQKDFLPSVIFKNDYKDNTCNLRELLTCKKCKFFKPEDNNYGKCEYFHGHYFSVYIDDYCSWGEYKTEI